MNGTEETMATTLLTLEEVDGWREELRKARQVRENADAKIKVLEAKLAAAQLFVSENASSKVLSSNGPGQAALKLENEPPVAETMHQAIIRLLKPFARGLEPKDISKLLREDSLTSDKIKNAHPNYIYTALMRLLQRKELVKYGASYRVAPKTDGDH